MTWAENRLKAATGIRSARTRVRYWSKTKIEQTSKVTCSPAAFWGGSSAFGGGGGGGGGWTTAAAWAAGRFSCAGTCTAGSAIWTMLFRLIDRMALFTLSHLLLYVRGETAENSTWLITSELANQRAQKALFTCVVYMFHKVLKASKNPIKVNYNYLVHNWKEHKRRTQSFKWLMSSSPLFKSPQCLLLECLSNICYC